MAMMELSRGEREEQHVGYWISNFSSHSHRGSGSVYYMTTTKFSMLIFVFLINQSYHFASQMLNLMTNIAGGQMADVKPDHLHGK